MQEIYWLAEWLSASEKALCRMELYSTTLSFCLNRNTSQEECYFRTLRYVYPSSFDPDYLNSFGGTSPSGINLGFCMFLSLKCHKEFVSAAIRFRSPLPWKKYWEARQIYM
jgi:hypothetical protein